jgi:CBS domain-containing membrane protein
MLENVRGGALARDVMTVETSIVAPEDGIGIIVQLLSDSGVQAAPVLSDGRIIGIVTRSDLLAVLARRTILAGLIQRAA